MTLVLLTLIAGSVMSLNSMPPAWELEQTFSTESGALTRQKVGFSSNCKSLVVATRGSCPATIVSVVSIDLQTQVRRTYTFGSSSHAELSPDLAYVANYSDYGILPELLNLSTGLIQKFTPLHEIRSRFCFSLDSKYLILPNEYSTQAYTITQGSQKVLIPLTFQKNEQKHVYTASYSPWLFPREVDVATFDDLTFSRDENTLRFLRPSRTPRHHFELRDDGTLVGFDNSTGTSNVLVKNLGTIPQRFLDGDNVIYPADITPDDRTLAVICREKPGNVVKIVDINSGTILQTILLPKIHGLRFSSDGLRLYVYGTDKLHEFAWMNGAHLNTFAYGMPGIPVIANDDSRFAINDSEKTHVYRRRFPPFDSGTLHHPGPWLLMLFSALLIINLVRNQLRVSTIAITPRLALASLASSIPEVHSRQS